MAEQALLATIATLYLPTLLRSCGPAPYSIIEAEKLKCRILLRDDVPYADIIAALGGEEMVDLHLEQIFAAFADQKNGLNGPLFTNGYDNVFHTHNDAGILQAVGGRFYSPEGWILIPFLATETPNFGIGTQFFSR